MSCSVEVFESDGCRFAMWHGSCTVELLLCGRHVRPCLEARRRMRKLGVSKRRELKQEQGEMIWRFQDIWQI